MLIGHDRTYDRLAGNPLKGQAYATQASPEVLQPRLDALKAQPAPTDPQQLAMRQRQIAAQELHIQQEKDVTPTPPTTTFSTRMTLHRGTREIQIYYLGRSHTDTDIFKWSGSRFTLMDQDDSRPLSDLRTRRSTSGW